MIQRRSVLKTLTAGAAVSCLSSRAAAVPSARPLLARPPMGWNSYDAYDSRITEQQYLAVVDYMAKDLLPLGWEYAVIDYIWFNPAPGNWDNPKRRFGDPDIRLDASGRPIDKLAMDPYGRLLPAVERFPSAAGGKGFRPIADRVHGKGMKFGIHIMRGIPRQAYFDKCRVKGTRFTAADIANPNDICSWCNNMFGVDATKPGAQEYYNSIFDLYAQWGVDFIKLDDLLFPVYHKGELELVHHAIQRCGRPMALSLSPGEAPLGRARHLVKNAQMWRISGDFWDDWKSLRHNFDLLNAWSSWAAPDSWPDGDMLPIGHISLGGRPHGPDRQSHFTWPEHYTLMSLWSIARSPLMVGADLPSSSEESLRFLKNKEVLAVNQHSENNHQVFQRHDKAAWIADVPGSPDKYLALFNMGEAETQVAFTFQDEALTGKYRVRDLWSQKDLGAFDTKFSAGVDPHGTGLYRLSALPG